MTFVLRKTKQEKHKILQEVIALIEKEHYSLADVGEKYGVSKQAVSQFLQKNNYDMQELRRDAMRRRYRRQKIEVDARLENQLVEYRKKIHSLTTYISNLKQENKKLKNKLYGREDLN